MHTVSIIDWCTSSVLVSAFVSEDKVRTIFTGVRGAPIVTAGVRNIRFWSFEDNRLIGRKGVLPRSGLVVRCGAVLDVGLILAGCLDGNIDVWQRDVVISTVEAHTGAVIDLLGAGVDDFISCGHDLTVKVWCRHTHPPVQCLLLTLSTFRFRMLLTFQTFCFPLYLASST